MSTYKIEVTKPCAKDLRDLPPKIKQALVDKLDSLAAEPRPSGCKKLKGFDNKYRIRSGSYRLIYEISDSKLLIIAICAGHRKDIYKAG